jgi:hypothetical protein
VSRFQKPRQLERLRAMPRPSKGDRGAHMVKTHPDVAKLLVEKVSAAGVSSVSQYIADVLAIHVDLPAHVRELNQVPLTGAGARTIEPLRGNRIMIRPHHEVSKRLARRAAQAMFAPGGVSGVSPYIADVLATHVGLPQHVRQLNTEVLPLAM